jgi:hypothetical protein
LEKSKYWVEKHLTCEDIKFPKWNKFFFIYFLFLMTLLKYSVTQPNIDNIPDQSNNYINIYVQSELYNTGQKKNIIFYLPCMLIFLENKQIWLWCSYLYYNFYCMFNTCYHQGLCDYLMYIFVFLCVNKPSYTYFFPLFLCNITQNELLI